MAVLAALVAAGVVERAGRDRFLRITPRFLAHTQGVSARMHAPDREVLRQALVTWDDYRHDPQEGSRFLHDSLSDQLGSLRPLFPAIEAFPAAA